MQLIESNRLVVFKCYKCFKISTDTKLIQIDGFNDPSMFHAVRLCADCINYLKDHKFKMSEDF